MNLLGTEKYKNKLACCLGEANSKVVVLSAFVTAQGFQWILNCVKPGVVIGQLVVRWRPIDLMSGASSLDVYDLAKKSGWAVFVCPDLHAKSILIDRSIVFIGSANVTGCGLSILSNANRELGVTFYPSRQDIKVFEDVLSESTLVTDTLVEKIKSFLSTQIDSKADLSGCEWPEELKRVFNKRPEKLWVADLLWSSPEELLNLPSLKDENRQSAIHDLNLLGLQGAFIEGRDVLREAFLECRVWKWLEGMLCSAEGELYFGSVVAALHDSLIDDPRPYRKEVKGLVKNIYAWSLLLGEDYVRIDIPGEKSQRIRYLRRTM